MIMLTCLVYQPGAQHFTLKATPDPRPLHRGGKTLRHFLLRTSSFLEDLKVSDYADAANKFATDSRSLLRSFHSE